MTEGYTDIGHHLLEIINEIRGFTDNVTTSKRLQVTPIDLLT